MVHEANSLEQRNMESANDYCVCISSFLLISFFCRFPPHLLKEKKKNHTTIVFSLATQVKLTMDFPVKWMKNVHMILHCLTSWRLQHIGHNSQLAKASIFVGPRGGGLPSSNVVFLVYKLCGPSILRNRLRKPTQKSHSYLQGFRQHNPRTLFDG